MTPTTDDEYSDEEAERRAREAIRRSFEMPHKPHKEMVGKVGRAKSPRPTEPKVRSRRSIISHKWRLKARPFTSAPVALHEVVDTSAACQPRHELPSGALGIGDAERDPLIVPEVELAQIPL